jgi:hypothetical protein
MNVFGSIYYSNDESTVVDAARNVVFWELVKKYPEVQIRNYIETNYPKNYDEWIPYFHRQIELSKPFLLPEFVDMEVKGIQDVSPDIYRSFHKYLPNHEDQSLSVWIKIMRETLIHLTIFCETMEILLGDMMPLKLEHLDQSEGRRRLIMPFGNEAEGYGFHDRTKERYKVQKKFLEDFRLNFIGYGLSTKWIYGIIRDIIAKQLEEKKLTKEGNARLLDEIDSFTGVRNMKRVGWNYYRYDLIPKKIYLFNGRVMSVYCADI